MFIYADRIRTTRKKGNYEKTDRAHQIYILQEKKHI